MFEIIRSGVPTLMICITGIKINDPKAYLKELANTPSENQ